MKNIRQGKKNVVLWWLIGLAFVLAVVLIFLSSSYGGNLTASSRGRLVSHIYRVTTERCGCVLVGDQSEVLDDVTYTYCGRTNRPPRSDRIQACEIACESDFGIRLEASLPTGRNVKGVNTGVRCSPSTPTPTPKSTRISKPTPTPDPRR